MKRIFILLLIAIISLEGYTQYLNVTDVYFTRDPSGPALPDTGLTPGEQLILKFDFKNNLGPGISLNPGDSVTFGWSVLGTTIGFLGTKHWPNHMAPGLSAKLYSHSTIPMPSDSCFSWEVCVWPMFNPYAPNTDSTKGNHCTTFKTSGCKTIVKPTFISLKNDDNTSNFYVVNHSLFFEFPTENDDNRIELFNLAGEKVLSKRVSAHGMIHVYEEIVSGVYIMKAANNESQVIQKVFIK